MKETKSILTVLAVAGNTLFFLWILYNGINEHFEGTVYQKISYFGMMGLLTVNTILILDNKKEPVSKGSPTKTQGAQRKIL